MTTVSQSANKPFKKINICFFFGIESQNKIDYRFLEILNWISMQKSMTF